MQEYKFIEIFLCPSTVCCLFKLLSLCDPLQEYKFIEIFLCPLHCLLFVQAVLQYFRLVSKTDIDDRKVCMMVGIPKEFHRCFLSPFYQDFYSCINYSTNILGVSLAPSTLLFVCLLSKTSLRPPPPAAQNLLATLWILVCKNAPALPRAFRYNRLLLAPCPGPSILIGFS